MLLFGLTAGVFARNTAGTQFVRKAVAPFVNKKAVVRNAAPKASDDIPATTILDEDFSLWTAGTNDQPDSKLLGGSDLGYAIDNSLTKIPGWKGAGVAQAGGACALCYYQPQYGDMIYGHIQTPEMEMYGEVTLTLRARRNDVADAEGKLRIALCDNDQGPIDDRDFTITKEWQTIEFKSDQGTFNNRNIFQISGEDCQVLIDDIKIVRRITKIATPNILSPENISATSFLARWQPVSAASSYLLNIYRKELPANPVPKTVIEEGFDGINVKADGEHIDTANPNYPEGWTIDVSTHGDKDVCTTAGDFSSGKLALNFDAEGDSIVSPETKAPVTHISFWVKPTTIEEEPDWEYTLLQVSVYNKKTGWTPIANLPNYWMKEGGGPYEFDSEAIGDGVTRVKLELIQKNLVSFAVDDVKITYQSIPEPVKQLQTELTDTTFLYDKVDPQYEYFYNVTAKDGSITSDPSPDMWVDGIVGVTPEVTAATDISSDGFTANWKEIHNAASYKVNVYEVVEAKEDTPDFVVLKEDFSGVKTGTIDNPQTPYTTIYSLSQNDQMTATDWNLQLPQLAEGMAGAQATNFWSNTAGLVASPRLDLSAASGAFDVDVTAYNTYPGDTLFVMLLKKITDNVATDSRKFPMKQDAAGFTTATVHFDGGVEDSALRKDVILAFMSMYGQPFYIDNVTVRQDVKKGERVTRPYKTLYPTTNSLVLTGLTPGNDYAYEVTALRTKSYVDYVSETSAMEYVDLPNATGIKNVASSQTGISAGKGCLYITSSAASSDIAVFDATGRTVYATATPAGTTSITLPAGLYIVKTKAGAQKVMVK